MKFAIYKLIRRAAGESGLEVILPVDFDATFANVIDRVKCDDMFVAKYGERAFRNYILVRIDDHDESVVS